MSCTEASRNFYEKCDKEKPLSKEESKQLRNYILSHFLEAKLRLTNRDIDKISEDIQVCFPKENKCIYYNSETKSGLLYSDYNNKAKALRTSNLYPTFRPFANKKRKLKEDAQVEHVDSVNDTNVQLSDRFVRNPIESELDLQELYFHWVRSLPIRLSKMKAMSKTEKLTLIQNEYKPYKRADGYVFVSTGCL